MLNFRYLTLFLAISFVLMISCGKKEKTGDSSSSTSIPNVRPPQTVVDEFAMIVAPADLNLSLISSNTKNYTIGDYIDDLQRFGNRAHQYFIPNRNLLMRNLEEKIPPMALVVKAREEGLDKTSNVKEQYALAEEQAMVDRIEDLYITFPSEPTEEDVKAHYEKYKNTRYASVPEQVRVSQIVVETEETANEVKDALANGQQFMDLAREYSIDKKTALRGGGVGWIREGMSGHNEIISTAFQLANDGDVSDPIKTSKGYVILKREEYREPRTSPYERVRRRIERELRTERQDEKKKELMPAWIKDLNVTIREDLLKMDNIRDIDPDVALAIVSDIDTIMGGEFIKTYRPVGGNDDFDSRYKYLMRLLEYPVMLGVAKQKNLSNDEYVIERATEASERTMILELRQMIADSIEITDKDVRDFYEKSQEEIRARHILVDTPGLAENILDRLKSGEDFAELAKEYSTDDVSAKRGGDLGYFRWGTMVAPFQEAAFSLQPQEISPIVETMYGYHLIKVEDRRTVNVKPFETVEHTIRAQVARLRTQQAVDQYIEDLKAEYNFRIEPANVTKYLDYCETFQTQQQQADVD